MGGRFCQPGCTCNRHGKFNTEDRFWAKVQKTDDCWLWVGATQGKGAAQGNGYGSFWADGKHIPAHRYAYELLVGPIPEGLQLDHRHTCLKRCVRPDHLRPLTNDQNRENLAGAYACNGTGVRGVTLRSNGTYQAELTKAGKRYYVGCFSTLEAAAEAVRAKRLEVFTFNDADRTGIDQAL